MDFPLLNYLQVNRDEITIVDILTKAKLCTVENLPKFIGTWSPAKQTFDQKCPFWEGPSQKIFCELIWRLNLEETKSQLNRSFSTHKLITPQITQNNPTSPENSQEFEKIEDVLDALKIEIDEDFLPENFSENPQKVQKVQ